MLDTPAPAQSGPGAAPAGLADVLLNISLTGLMLMRPHYGADGTITDFTHLRLNPAAQHMLALPEYPESSFLTQYPSAAEAGVFGFYRDAFLSGQPQQRQNLYQHDGLDGYYWLAAQRYDDVLVVSFNDASNQPRSVVEEALRQSHAQERAARAAAETTRHELQRAFEQAPLAIAVYRGPRYTIELANATVARLWGRTQEELIGKGLFEALPEVAGMGYEELLDHVMATGETHVAHAMEAQHDRNGRRETVYWDFVYVPVHNDAGRIDGAMVVATEVTAQVLARRQMEQLNHTLEQQVLARTREVEQQSRLLERLIQEAPAAICTLAGPELVFELVNPKYQALFPGRQLVGRSIFEALPEAAEPIPTARLRHVYDTGISFEGTEFRLPAPPDQGPTSDRYFNFVYQARYDAAGSIDGLVLFVFEVTQQVQARLAREAQQQLVETVFEQAPVGIFVMSGPSHVLEIVNPPAAALLGHPPAALLGRPFFEAVPELASQAFPALLRQVWDSGEAIALSEQPAHLPYHEPGEVSYFSFVYQPLKDEQGQVTAIACVATDVTDQVRSRQQVERLNQELEAAGRRLAQEREDFYQVLAQTPAAIGILRGPEHRYEYANLAFQRLLPGRDLLGEAIAEITPEAAAQGFVTLLDEVYRTGQTHFGYETPFVLEPTASLPGYAAYFNFVYSPYREAGRIVGVSIFAYDVTEQVQAKRLREAQQAELQRIFQQAPVAITILRGPQLLIELANDSAAAIWGRPAAAVLGKPYFEALPDITDQGFEEILHWVLSSGEQFSLREAPVRLDNEVQPPRQAYFSLVFHPLRDAQQHTVGVIVVGADVTDTVLARERTQLLNADLTAVNAEMQNLNEELRAVNEKLQSANAELHETNNRLIRTNADLDTFVYSASHDLKAPIINIEGLLQALRQHLPASVLQDELVQHLLDLMGGAASRFQQTLGHLTDVSRLQQTLFDQPAEAVELTALVEDVRLDMQPELAAAGATLTTDLAQCPTLYLPAKNLRSILYNLLSNAVKYRHPERPPQVWVRCHRPGPDQVALEVQDNGLGLSTHQQGELFRLFRRLHDHVTGSGVGLYMVKRMVDNAGGTLSVQSEPGVGSTFTVTLPLLSQPA